MQMIEFIHVILSLRYYYSMPYLWRKFVYIACVSFFQSTIKNEYKLANKSEIA